MIKELLKEKKVSDLGGDSGSADALRDMAKEMSDLKDRVKERKSSNLLVEKGHKDHDHRLKKLESNKGGNVVINSTTNNSGSHDDKIKEIEDELG